MIQENTIETMWIKRSVQTSADLPADAATWVSPGETSRKATQLIHEIMRNRSSLFYLPREGNGTPLQHSCLENSMDGGTWWAAVHGVVKSQTRLSDFTFTFHFPALEKEMATHSSVLAWRIPGTREPSGLPSMGSHRVGHDWSDLAAAAAAHFHHFYSTQYWEYWPQKPEKKKK